MNYCNSAMAQMLSISGYRLINPHWSVSADGWLHYRRTGHLPFNPVIKLPFYTAHADWSVHYRVDTGEAIRFTAVAVLPGEAGVSYEYRAATNTVHPVSALEQQSPNTQLRRSPGLQSLFITALGLEEQLRVFAGEWAIHALGFTATDDYLQSVFGERWQQVKAALNAPVEV